jgi:prepilin-type N-terminal cleavage/methylation domain-containing protein
MRTRRGFTLLELIVAMGIMVLVATTLVTTITSAFTLKKSAENAVDATRGNEVVGDIFATEVANALQPSAYSVDTMTSVATAAAAGITADTAIPWYCNGPFMGDSNQVTFYTSGTEPRGTVQGDVRYVEFGLAQQKDGTNALVRRQRVNLLALPEEQPENTGLVEEVLIQHVESVEFQYFDGSAWQATWDTTTNENRLPYAVSMQLQLSPRTEGGPVQVLRRVATVIGATASNAAADAAADAAAGTTGG